MPQSHVLRVFNEPLAAESSTDSMYRALDRLMGITAAERALEDKALRSELTIDEQAELDRLRADRESAKPH